MSSCPHPALFQNMCVSCGKKIDNSDLEKSDHKSKLSVGGHTLFLSKNEAESVQTSKISGLKKIRKLALILDLDNTLLHATHIQPAIVTNDIRRIELIDDRGICRSHWVKLRPHLESFLKTMASYFQMSIYTAGTRQYAEHVAAILDQDGTYFGKRIVSRTDVPELSGKSLELLFLSDLSMALILDDRQDVWSGPQQKHLLPVAPYVYFGNEPLYPTVTPIMSNITSSESEESTSTQFSPQETDFQLSRCATVLKQLHLEYYSQLDSLVHRQESTTFISQQHTVCVSKVLRQLRRKVLQNCSLTFTGVIPVGCIRPETHPMWLLALSLGAIVTSDLTSSTTHLITNTNIDNSRTIKTNKAMATKSIWIVHVDWLSKCLWDMERVTEVLYLQAPPPTQLMDRQIAIQKSSSVENISIVCPPMIRDIWNASDSITSTSQPPIINMVDTPSQLSPSLSTTSSVSLSNSSRGLKRERSEDECRRSSASSSDSDGWLEELENELE